MLERACKMLADQFIGDQTIDTDIQKFQELPSTELGGYGISVSEVPYILQPQGANCSAESCLTSLESLRGLTLEGSLG
ncbi:myb-like transcription factor family protein, partial [Trifolium medium]|nr:myb-like transcription factor family protein [Trifolium medium]